jgi:hypothetical protein
LDEWFLTLPMKNQRLLRDRGDGDDMVGFTLTVDFSEG